jgi:hypothetical protein
MGPREGLRLASAEHRPAEPREKVTPPFLLRPLHTTDTIVFSGVVVKASEARSKSNAPLQHHLLELTSVIGGQRKW